MRGLLFDGGPNAGWVFLLVTIVLGGAGAWATGRAFAATWRPLSRILPAALGLSLGVCFLHYALFGEAALSRLAGDAGAFGELAASLHYLAITFAILTGFAAAGFRLTRSRQLKRQYPWIER